MPRATATITPSPYITRDEMIALLNQHTIKLVPLAEMQQPAKPMKPKKVLTAEQQVVMNERMLKLRIARQAKLAEAKAAKAAVVAIAPTPVVEQK